MTNRWLVLALLFCVRVTMAFQYQAVAALSPFLMDRFGVGLADIGLLIGLYLSPGMVIALPGGAIGRRFGDKRTVAFGLALMLAGGLVIALVPSWEAQVGGRILSGVGGVTLNVLMSKMVADWFAGREIASAMGIFINSWPVGIAAALMVQPLLAQSFGLSATMLVIAGLVAAGFLALVVFYRAPPGTAAATVARVPLRGAALSFWPDRWTGLFPGTNRPGCRSGFIPTLFSRTEVRPTGGSDPGRILAGFQRYSASVLRFCGFLLV